MSRMENSGEQPTQQQGEESGGGIREKAQELGQGLREIGQQARTAAQEQYENLRQQASEYYETGRQHAMEWEQSLEDYVRQQPVKSLLIAAGIGVILGALWKRS